MIQQYTKPFKTLALLICVAMIGQMIAPLTAWSLTSGPLQPEFTNFEPVATTNMVNEFSGEFTYNLPVINIPGANGGGYALSLSYHSGAQPLDDASWVGYGWSLNPGAILRGTKGFPDDYHEQDITYYNRTKPNWTFTAGKMLNLELFSGDSPFGDDGLLSELGNNAVKTPVGGRHFARLNSYKGFGYVLGLSTTIFGVANFGYALADNSGSFSATIRPGSLLLQLSSKLWDAVTEPGELGTMELMQVGSPTERKSKKWASFYQNRAQGIANSAVGGFTQYDLGTSYAKQLPMNITPYENANSFNLTAGAEFLDGMFKGVQGQVTANYTYQAPIDERSVTSWGYMYTGEVSDTNHAMDYFIEKDAPYSERDKFLPIPFNNADQFSLTGEGLGGGFRLHQGSVGIYRPPSRSSNTKMWDIGYETGIGAGSSVGINFGFGVQDMESGDWRETRTENRNGHYQFPSESETDFCTRNDDPYFFRFNGDLGGAVTYSYSDDPIELRHPGDVDEPAVIPRTVHPTMNMGLRDGRSSHVSFATNAELTAKYDATQPPAAIKHPAYVEGTGGYTAKPELLDYYMRQEVPHGIGEFAVTDPNGSKYIYGLPMYTAQEYNLTYLNGFTDSEAGIENSGGKYVSARMRKGSSPGTDVENYVKNQNVKVVGQKKEDPYASSYLLTEIRSPDYIDVDGNGPDHNDLGAWVRFDYNIVHGKGASGYDLKNDWYRYRIPYEGLSFSPGSLSDPEDDAGGLQSGYKQMSYLHEIHTKSHVAKFTVEDRQDGLSADKDEWKHIGESQSTDFADVKVPKRLTKIELFAKSISGAEIQPAIKTVHFDYDYEVYPGTHNSQREGTEHLGRLTLKNVWFEYNGVVETHISPYKFDYTYKPSSEYRSNGGVFVDKHGAIVDFAGRFTASAQTPEFEEANVDSWGNYAYNEVERKKRLQIGVNQNPDEDDFDPAAWQLKRITLPSGGEIHVQYEQHDYNYVQGQRAMVLAPIHAEAAGVGDGDTKTYYLDLNDVPGGQSDIDELEDLIDQQFVKAGEEIYCKFLFSIEQDDDDNTPLLQKPHLRADYVTGYSRVTNVEKVDDNGQLRLAVTLEHAPRSTCLDYYESNRIGFADGYETRKRMGTLSIETPLVAVSGLGELMLIGNRARTGDACNYFDPTNSYLRIPVASAKKGGGVRVKRLLMYDKGLDSDAGPELYGAEYVYEMEDEVYNRTISSGVACNEPSGMREENPLVKSLKKRSPQSGWARWTAGEDKEQFEGPIGESLLPGPSIGYARVVVKNIYENSVNGSGFRTHEFYTCKEFPFDVDSDGYENGTTKWTENPMRKNDYVIPAGLYQESSAEVRGLQGYSFVLNSMHGQVKRVSTSIGEYDDPDSHVEVMYTENEYFVPGEQVPMFYGLDKPFRMENPGKEMDVTIETRKVTDGTTNFAAQSDLTFALAIIPTIWPSLLQDDTEYRQTVSSKVVRYPVLPKSVRTFKDGVHSDFTYVAFDPVTGSPVVTRSTDEYHGLTLENGIHNGTVHTYNLMAWTEYQDMGAIGDNEGMVLEFQHIDEGQVQRGALNATAESGGHVIQIDAQSTGDIDMGYLNFVRDVFSPGSRVELTYVDEVTQQQEVRIVDLGGAIFDPIHPERISYTLYREGYSNISAGSVFIRAKILRSGRDNNLNAQIGTLVTYGEDKTAALNWARELRRREAITEHLNNQLFDCGEMSVGRRDLPEVGNWWLDENEFEPTVHRAYNWDNKYRVNFWIGETNGDQDLSKLCYNVTDTECADPNNPPGIVVRLNNYLNSHWTQPIVTPNQEPIESRSYNRTPVIRHGFSDFELTNTFGGDKVDLLKSGITSEMEAELLTGDGCVAYTKLGAKALFDTEFRLRVNSGPNAAPSGQVQTNYAFNTDTQAPIPNTHYLSNLHLVSANTEEPLLRYSIQYESHVNNWNLPTEQCCNVNFTGYIIPGTDAQLADAMLSRDDFTETSLNVFDLYETDFTSTVGEFGVTVDGKLKFTKKLINTKEFIYPDFTFEREFDPSNPQEFATTVKETLHRSTGGPGYFAVSDEGDIVFYAHENSAPQLVKVFDFLIDGQYGQDLAGLVMTVAGPENDDVYHNTVLSASVTTFRDFWPYDEVEFGTVDMLVDPNNPGGDQSHPYMRHTQGRWRPHENWVVRKEQEQVDVFTTPLRAHLESGRTWNMGIMSTFTPYDFDILNHQNNKNFDNNWIKINRVEKYSPNGEALEEWNVLDVPSAAKFGYNRMLPIAVAQNAEYETILFESFEEYGTGLAHLDSWSHSGQYCAGAVNDNTILDQKLTWTNRLDQQGALLQFWMRFTTGSLNQNNLETKNFEDFESIPNVNLQYAKLEIFDGESTTIDVDLPAIIKVAQTGEWTLCQTYVNPQLTYVDALGATKSAVGKEFNIAFQEVSNYSPIAIWLDDIRFQPMESEMMAYVYDRSTMRVVAMFDDQHFGVYYQYDGQGRLVRTIRETERGLQTIREGHIFTPKTERPGLSSGVYSAPESGDDRMRKNPNDGLDNLRQNLGDELTNGDSFELNRSFTLPGVEPSSFKADSSQSNESNNKDNR